MSHTRRLAQIVLSIIMILSMGLSLTRPKSASAQGNDGLKRQFNAQTGKVSFIGPQSGRSLSAERALGISPSARPADPAMALAKRFSPQSGVEKSERHLPPAHTRRP